MAKDEVASLREATREAHEAAQNVRDAIREGRTFLREMEEVRSRLVTTAQEVFDEQMDGDVAAFLAEYRVAMDDAIEKGTQAVFERFDRLTNLILTGHDNPRPTLPGTTEIEQMVEKHVRERS